MAKPPIENLPIIDISPFLDPECPAALQDLAARDIGYACQQYGFFYVKGHGIPNEKLDQIIALAREFFSLPMEEKEKIKRYDAGGPEGGDGARGYQGMGENITDGKRDVQEAVDFYREWGEDSDAEKNGPPFKTLHGPNLWPEKPEVIKPVYLDYIEKVKAIGKILVRAMGMALELPPSMEGATQESEDREIFVRNTDRCFWVMRLIGYPPLENQVGSREEGDIEEFSCGAHTDYGCLTLLLSDPTPSALQVQLRDGTWMNADPIKGAFVINIGDMIERWTNGVWKSTRHRVIHRGNNYRVSVPFFFEPNFDAVVKPLGECVQMTGGESLYEKTTYGKHLLGKVFGNFI
ncbi:Clavaminate synthase-like protein [Delitschia confertaspora ATCC 74209]|uniref:Clavaminate synthase-like protein n=1 Tax=Delitschia confertaspora ATCC 74209 TaxID=1513339 RepID=A0A9P4MUE4_9PLEO|nr:Clavaminate synthase-like protein [Delitschia confertaspora ATCC 74209]